MTRKFNSLFLILVIGGALISCAGPRPYEEIALARSALEAAKESGAPTVAPGYWHRAEENYRKGNKALSGNYNFDAKKYFIDARISAEKAENSARLKKFKSGEGF